MLAPSAVTAWQSDISSAPSFVQRSAFVSD
jgi:hypothetical protein